MTTPVWTIAIPPPDPNVCGALFMVTRPSGSCANLKPCAEHSAPVTVPCAVCGESVQFADSMDGAVVGFTDHAKVCSMKRPTPPSAPPVEPEGECWKIREILTETIYTNTAPMDVADSDRQIAALKARVAELNGIVRTYADHDGACPWYSSAGEGEGKCDCGFAAIVKEFV